MTRNTSTTSLRRAVLIGAGPGVIASVAVAPPQCPLTAGPGRPPTFTRAGACM